MSFLSQIVADLREQRLLPVVALLIGATIALPIVVGGSSASPTTTFGRGPRLPPGASALLTPQIRALVAATSPDAGAVHVSGRLHDPFLVTSAPPAVKTATTTSATSGTSAAAATSTSTTTSPTGGTSTGTGTHTTTCSCKNQTPQGTVFTIALQFGQAASVHRITAPVRLAPFPSDSNPQVAYLGVRQGGGSAMFVVSHGAIAAGDGACQPSANNCQVVTMKPGDTEYFDVTTPTQGLVQYELDLLSISSRHTQTRAAAMRVNRLVSSAGVTFARAVNSSVVAKLAFSLVNGVLIPTVKGGGKAAQAQAQLRTAALPTGAVAGIFTARRNPTVVPPRPAVMIQPAPAGLLPVPEVLTLPAA